MTTRRISLTWPVFILVAIGMTAVGVMTAYVAGRQGLPTQIVREDAGHPEALPSSAVPAAEPPVPHGATMLADVRISVAPELAQRARLEVETVRSGRSSTRLRIPGIVEANAYKQVSVAPLVGGRVTRVAVALGDRIRRGETLAEIDSPELAQARTTYLSMEAELEAAHQKLQRTRRLVEIGAASRQELEETTAEHTKHEAGLREARARLSLLGVADERLNGLRAESPNQAAMRVAAPVGGVVIKRQVNVGSIVEPMTEARHHRRSGNGVGDWQPVRA
jgi:cobalt-zinc-cadmium efflux system membrane fusion protein